MSAMPKQLPYSERAAAIIATPLAGEVDRIAGLVRAAGVDEGVAAMLAAAIVSGQRFASDSSYAPGWLFSWMQQQPRAGAFLPRTTAVDTVPSDTTTVGSMPAHQRAERYARRTHEAAYVRASAYIGARHLLAAIIDEIRAVSLSRLAGAGLDLRAFRPHFLDKLKADASSVDDRAAWEAIFAEQDRRLAGTNYLPGYSADRTDVADALGVADEAAIFARLICYEQATPPLSVGLFGEWGSGKSFFMERIETEVDALVDARLRLRMEAQAAGATAGPLRVDAFVTDVMQLRFNAWHYADGDTFASLTAEIFDQLRIGGHKGRDGAARQRLYDLVTRDIVETGKRRDEGKAAAAAEEKKAESAAVEIEALRQARQALELKSFGEIANETLAELLAKPADGAKANKARDAVDAAGKTLGIEGLAGKTDDLRAELAGISTTGGKLFLVLRSLAAGSGWGVAVFVMVAVFASLLVAFTLHTADWVRFLAALAAAAAPLAALLAALLRAYRAVKPIIELSARYADRLKEKQDENARKIAEKTAELTAAQVKKAEALAAVAAAEARLVSLPGSATADGRATLLRYFLFETEDTRGFEKTLGVIHRARRAFETLDAIIVDYRDFRALNRKREAGGALNATEQKAFDDGDKRFRAVLDEERRDRAAWWAAHAEESDARPPRGPIPDRVVLYIDDLDRCRADQVVKVLEAVHLLLAFRSFVVVVGVDARWIRSALAKHYEAQIATAPTGNKLPIATPDDYLEKIFQIPFWLRPISVDADDGTLGPLLRGIAGEPLPDPAVETADVEPTVKAAAAGAATASADAPPPGLDLVRRDPAEERELQFFAREHRVFEALGPLIARSPRSVKRYVNSYRLIRDRFRGDLDAFAGEAPDAPLVAVALLLAIEVGLSRTDRDAAMKRLSDMDDGWRLTNILMELGAPPADQRRSDFGTPWSWEDRLRASVARLSDGGFDLTPKQLAEQQPLVGRLSFHGPGRDA